jgi:hypothetical protein
MIRQFDPILKAFIILAVLAFGGCSSIAAYSPASKGKPFSFIVTSDMRNFASPEYDSSKYFSGTCEAIGDVGRGAFMVSPGDIDPPQYVYATVQNVLGKDYSWYAVIGDHEAETPADMKWLRKWGDKDIPNLVRRGPEHCKETIYSFDYNNAHFVVLNQYCDGQSDVGTDGDVCETLFKWLKEDLEDNDKPFVFVFGHEPLVSIPDVCNGRHRHIDDSLNAHTTNSHRFRQLLFHHKVTAYVCGHTHNCSFAKINGLWQVDAGHARGIGDKGARSTFLKIWVSETQATVYIYRDDRNGGPYSLAHTVELN